MVVSLLTDSRVTPYYTTLAVPTGSGFRGFSSLLGQETTHPQVSLLYATASDQSAVLFHVTASDWFYSSRIEAYDRSQLTSCPPRGWPATPWSHPDTVPVRSTRAERGVAKLAQTPPSRKVQRSITPTGSTRLQSGHHA